MSLSDAERLHNVADHVKHLSVMLAWRESDGGTQRIYRARTIMHDEFVVMTILQNLPGHQGRAEGSIRLYIASTHSGAEPLATLTGQYAVDEIVAFLGLDMIARESLEWTDETKHSSLVVVGDILRKLR